MGQVWNSITVGQLQPREGKPHNNLDQSLWKAANSLSKKVGETSLSKDIVLQKVYSLLLVLKYTINYGDLKSKPENRSCKT